MRYNVGIYADEEVTELGVSRVPWWADLLMTIADRVCVLTRHRWCHRIFTPVSVLADRHAEVWRTQVSRDTAKDCLRWLGVDDRFPEDEE